MTLKTDIDKCTYFRFNFVGKSTIQIIGRDKEQNKIFEIKFRDGSKLHDKFNKYMILRSGNINPVIEPIYEGSWRLIIVDEDESELE
jgi:hypothetical protein